MTPITQDTRSSVRLQCLEIWGGNQAADSVVSVPGVDAHVVSRPHQGHAGGGDVHYVSTCAAGIISRFALADVSGHGQTVAHVADALRRLMRRHMNTVDQSRIARALNREFAGLASAGRFATAVLATYFEPTDHLIVCNAGHPRPLFCRDGSWSLLDERSAGAIPRGEVGGIANLPLGIIEPTDYAQFAVPLARGDIALFYTDAIIEAAPPGGPALGEAGLLDLASTLDPARPEALAGALSDAVARHRGRREADDDETVLVLHHNGAAAPGVGVAQRVRAWGRMLLGS
ncbi:MAG: serine/threonine-protein phosphatase [Phycisphaerae bacterium]|nr:serine/threonine-protein phosphatase [Phycisphaerae bacterium]